MIINHRIRNLLAALSLLAPLGLGGCGSSSPAAVSDASVAKTTLTKVLDAWKNGESSDAFSKAPPVIYVAEEEWKGGARLESYSIEPNEQMIGTSLHCPVNLKLKTPKGKSVSRKVTYIVMTTPVLRVDRLE